MGLDDARANQGQWGYCNYDDEGVGYPRDCGKTSQSGGKWFAMPSSSRYRGGWAQFELFTGAQCPAAFFTVVGPCTVDGACARSPNYPSAYGNSQSCTITPTSLAVGQLLSATAFTTESGYDTLIVNSAPYSGKTGPSNVLLGSASFTWSSDHSQTDTGWEVCATEDSRY